MIGRRGRAARVVLLDRHDRVLLINSRDPFDRRKPPWWEIPGGGVDGSEEICDAARRELFEETGIEQIEMGPLVWTQQVSFTFAGMRFESHDHIHVAWCESAEYRPQKLELLEAAAFQSARWWELDELLDSDEPTVPVRLREFLPALVAGDLPDEPIDIAPTEI